MKVTTRKDVLWGYLGYFFTYAVNLIILPILFSYISVDHLGLWYVFAAVGSLVTLIDTGFSTIITRYSAIIFSGSTQLQKTGIVNEEKDNTVSKALYEKFFKTVKIIYFVIFIIASILIFTLGTWYISTLADISASNIKYAWALYSLGTVINIYLNYWAALLRGINCYRESNIASVISKFIYVLISGVLLILNFDLISMGVALIISGIALRVICKLYYKKALNRTITFNDKVCNYTQKEIFKVMLPGTIKQSVIVLNSFLVSKAAIFFVSSNLGLEASTQYGLTIQIFDIIGALALTYISTMQPIMINARKNKEDEKVRQIFSRSLGVMLTISIIICVAFIFLGSWALKLIGYQSELLSRSQLAVFAIIYILTWNVSCCGTLISTHNQVPGMITALISGVLTIALTFLLLSVTSLGMWGIIIARLIVLIAIEGWYWPYRAIKSDNLKVKNVFKYYFEYIKELFNQFFKKHKKEQKQEKEDNIKEHMPKISIIMPTYNRIDMFKQALDSAINQETDVEYEVIVMNDYPKDDFEIKKVIEEANFDNIRYYKNEKNLGAVKNWNKGFSLAKAEYVTMLHDDDLLEKNFIEEITKHIKGNRLVIADYNLLDMRKDKERDSVENSFKLKLKKIISPLFSKRHKITPLSYFYRIHQQSTITAVYEKNAFLALGGFKEDFWPSVDTYFNYEYILKHGGVYVNKKLSTIRIFDNISMKECAKFPIQSYKLRQKIIDESSNKYINERFSKMLYLEDIDGLNKFYGVNIEKDKNIADFASSKKEHDKLNRIKKRLIHKYLRF